MTAPYAPTWLAPAQSGALTNKRATTQGGADDILLKVRYLNPRGSGSQVETVRFLATKVSKTGSRSTVLDTWHMGVGSFPAAPTGPSHTNASFVYDPGSGPRLYMKNDVVGIYSAPLSGPSYGQWRAETAFAAATATGITMVQANGYCYVAYNASGAIYYAPIFADGTFGTWKSFIAANALVLAGNELFAYTDGSGSYLYQFNSASTLTRGAKLNPDGTLVNNTWIIGGAQAANRGFCGCYFAPSGLDDGNGTLWFVGGYNNVAAVLTVASAPVTGGNGTIGAWAVAGTGLPLVRCNFGFARIGNQLYVVGGSSTVPGGGGTNTTTIYRITPAGLGTAWTTDATVLGTATQGGGVSSISPNEGITSRTSDQGQPAIFCMPGDNTVRVTRLKVNPSTLAVSAQAQVTAPSVGAELSAGNLGTGGVVTNNLDGTIDVTYAWGAVAALGMGAAGLVDGDVVTVSVQFTDAQDGDPSPAALTTFKVGQPPTLSNLLPGAAISTGGKLTASLGYNAGAGGGPEAKYRITVKIGGTTYFDSGDRYDSANAVLVDLAPLMVTATAYTFSWSVTSTDSVLFNGATNAATSTLAVTPTIVAPAAPTSLAAVPDNANGIINLTWTNPAPPATPGGRVYYRRNGAATWTLLADSAVAVAAYAAMDQIDAGVGYDFAVSQLNLAGGNAIESPLSNVVSNVKLDWSAIGTIGLHVAGKGATYRGIFSIRRGSLVYTSHKDAAPLEGFASLAPSVRYGVLNYRTVEFELFLNSVALLQTLTNIILQAQLGNALYFRDGFGVMFTAALDPTAQLTYQVPLYRYVKLRLVQVPNTFAPSVSLGVAQGFPTLASGSVPALDNSEQAP